MLGEHDYQDNSETNMVRMDVAEIVMHKDYDTYSTDYDFALLKLETRIEWSDNPHIRPVCLPGGTNDYAGDTAYVTGWVQKVT